MVNLTTEEAIKELSRYTDQEFYTPQNRAAHQMAIEALERGRWIPIEERLPDRSNLVVALTSGGDTLIARHDQYGWLIYGGRVVESGRPITHWMPLPDPPEKDGAT